MKKLASAFSLMLAIFSCIQHQTCIYGHASLRPVNACRVVFNTRKSISFSEDPGEQTCWCFSEKSDNCESSLTI
jgi:hypothetical protein